MPALRYERAAEQPPLRLRYLKRFALGTPYPEVVDEVRRLLQTPLLSGSVLAVDQTGVGRPVVEIRSINRKVDGRGGRQDGQ